MGSPGTRRILLLTVGLLAACADASPFGGDPDATAAPGTGGRIDGSGMDADMPPPPSDASSGGAPWALDSGGGGPDRKLPADAATDSAGEPNATGCADLQPQDPMCAFPAPHVAATGLAPAGDTFTDLRAQVGFMRGFIDTDSLYVAGSAAGTAFAVRVIFSTLDPVETGAVYRSGERISGTLIWQLHGEDRCLEHRTDHEPLKLELELDEYILPEEGAPEQGTPLSLVGKLAVRAPEWDVSIRFELDRSCGYSVSL